MVPKREALVRLRPLALPDLVLIGVMLAAGELLEALFERFDEALVGASIDQLRERLLR